MPVNQSLYIWAKTMLPNYILSNLGDRMEMAHSVEGRLPFLDHHVVEEVARMPVTMKISGLTEKYVLREAARAVLTDAVYRRQKHPFLSPPATLNRRAGCTRSCRTRCAAASSIGPGSTIARRSRPCSTASRRWTHQPGPAPTRSSCGCPASACCRHVWGCRTGPRRRANLSAPGLVQHDAMNSVIADLRYAGRELRRRPGFAITAVLSLALGIGATSAVFSVIYGVLLNPFPYVESERMMQICAPGRRPAGCGVRA